VYLYMYVDIYIYIYREREKHTCLPSGGKLTAQRYTNIDLCIYVYMHISERLLLETCAVRRCDAWDDRGVPWEGGASTFRDLCAAATGRDIASEQRKVRVNL